MTKLLVYRDNVAVIDVRSQLRNGEHPKQQIMDLVQGTEKGTVIEIHVTHPARPLIASLEALGLPAILNQLGPEHFRIMCVRM
jgi:hypothetical protein